MIRAARAQDAGALTRVIAAAYAPHAHLDLPPVAEGVAEDLHRHDAWVWEAGGAVLGGVIADLSSAHVINLAVAPEAAGQGVGRALIEEVARAARRRGHGHLGLATHPGMTGTLAFYAALGFRVVDRSARKVYLEWDIASKDEAP